MDPADDRMRSLLDGLDAPALIVRSGLVESANEAARAVLGEQILGQDVRLVIRHPAAVDLLARERGGSVTVLSVTDASGAVAGDG